MKTNYIFKSFFKRHSTPQLIDDFFYFKNTNKLADSLVALFKFGIISKQSNKEYLFIKELRNII